MPEKKPLERAARDRRQGKAPTTQAGEFVREQIEHVRAGKHGARSAKQAIAIGLSKARRAGVKLGAPSAKKTSVNTRRKAAADTARGNSPGRPVSRTRSRATTTALKREGRAAASKPALARQAKSAAKKRGASARSAAARKAVTSKAAPGRKAAAQNPALTRKR